jgi:hypothetical protein
MAYWSAGAAVEAKSALKLILCLSLDSKCVFRKRTWHALTCVGNIPWAASSVQGRSHWEGFDTAFEDLPVVENLTD